MHQWIALLRGINVGGKNKLPMVKLVEILTSLGFEEVQTYIQSGNAIFYCTEASAVVIEEKIKAAIKMSIGFEISVILIEPPKWQQAIDSNPFKACESNHKTLHLGFLLEKPSAPDFDAIEKIRDKNERYELIDCVFYICAPDGVGRSKLAAQSERHLGVPMTSRNWQTVMRINEMVKGQKEL